MKCDWLLYVDLVSRILLNLDQYFVNYPWKFQWAAEVENHCSRKRPLVRSGLETCSFQFQYHLQCLCACLFFPISTVFTTDSPFFQPFSFYPLSCPASLFFLVSKDLAFHSAPPDVNTSMNLSVPLPLKYLVSLPNLYPFISIPWWEWEIAFFPLETIQFLPMIFIFTTSP